ncbi:putative ribonuclease P protein subunit 1 [Elsinoe australis]|uniref:Ribonuclease P protein subunit n=1 Tax=Elsinoe australis TaxID=40998 RepID=A0A4V6DW85_9PEZI|nr:putative ribonuclease P protein subunit 1 [Elsinoe australis]
MAAQPPHPALALLSQAHDPSTASQIFTDSIKHRPLLLRPSSPDPSSATNARSARRSARRKRSVEAYHAFKKTHKSGRSSLTRKPRPLSAKAKRQLGVHEIGEGERKWGLYTELHQLWCGYMREVLALDDEGKGGQRKLGPDFVGPMVASADFHGAVVRVVRSGCVGRVGIRGIVVKDTKFTFEVVTKGDKLKVLPKEGTVFRVEVPRSGDALGEMVEGQREERLVVEIYGEQFMTSAPDRANKKFKMHIDPAL